MEFSQSPLDVLIGPTDSVTEDGHSLNETDYAYWDNSLTSEELELICGVYQVYTVDKLLSGFPIPAFPALPANCQPWPASLVYQCAYVHNKTIIIVLFIHII